MKAPIPTKLDRRHLPMRLPGAAGWFCLFTCLHYWHAPGWVYGVVGTFVAVVLWAKFYEKHRADFREPAWLPPREKGEGPA